MLNKVLYIGRISNELSLRTTSNGKEYIFFDLAINDSFGDNKNTNFINCIAWNKRAENLEKYQKKGNLILVEGKTESYKNKDGLTQTRCVALDIKFLEKKENNNHTEDISDPFSDEN